MARGRTRQWGSRAGLCLMLASVAAAATAAPRIGVSPASLERVAAAGTSAQLVLTLANSGDSPLHVTLTPRAPLPDAGGLRPGETLALHEGDAPAPGDAPAAPRAARPWALDAGPGAIPPAPAARASLTGVRALILHAGGQVDGLRSQLLAFPEFQAVDIRDLGYGPPSLDELRPYACVLVAVNSARFDEHTTGDVLADYVDGGGGLVLTPASFVSGYEIRGRLLADRYVPFLLGSGGAGSGHTLGAYDATHPIMAGITSVTCDLISDIAKREGATDVARWRNGLPLVATLPRVAAVNLFVALPGYTGGQAAELLRNALVWSVGQVDWIRLSETRLTLEPGTEAAVDVTLDATSLVGGVFTASIQVQHDDPSQGDVNVPVRLTVTGPPRLRLTAGEAVLSSMAIFSEQGQETVHHIVVPEPHPDTLRLELEVEGDFGDPEEFANVSVEGLSLGGVGQTGVDCTANANSFPLGRSLVRTLLADGAVDARVRNSALVDPLCPTNHHTVRLRYERPGDLAQFPPVFVGRASEAVLVFENVGAEMLRVRGVRTSDPAFTAAQETLSVAPHTRRALPLRFRPAAVGPASATLTFESDDPERPSVTVRLESVGLLPPELEVAPLALDARLPVGGRTTRQVTIHNTGGAPLPFRLRARGALRAVPRPRGVDQPFVPVPPDATARSEATDTSPAPTEPGVEADAARAPRSTVSGAVALRATAPAAMPGASVLILQDAEPWATQANENVLSSHGAAFDVATSAELDTLDLGRYRMVILASDQTMRAYARLGDHAEKLEDFVGAGGVLEAHVAGWGFNGGDATLLRLPGGVRVEHQTSDVAHIVLPGHPLAEGSPRDLPGTSASHAWLSGLPPDADVVAVDDFGFPVLAVYSLGRGVVVATGLTLEFGHAYGQTHGSVLEASIRYSLDAWPHWLSFEPASGELPPGGAMPVAVSFQAGGLDGGEHVAELDILSDDPDEPVLPVAVTLRVDGAPDLEALSRAVTGESRATYVAAGARTSHRIAVDRPRGTPLIVELEVFGDYGSAGEEASLFIEGARLGSVGGLGGDCVLGRRSFFVPQALADHVLADGILELWVQNSTLVDPTCASNEHMVRVSHPESPFPLRFLDTFTGGCDTRGFLLRNRGTSTLTVSALTTSDARFRVTPSSAVIEPRRELLVQAEFCPDVPGNLSATLRVQSDDPDTPDATLTLSGRAFAAPALETPLTGLSVDVFAGEVVTRTARLRNPGGSPLETRWLALADWHTVEPAATAAPGAPAGLGASEKPVRTPPVRGGPDSGTPTSLAPRALPAVASARARVLIIGDHAPWGRLTDEALLDSLGVPWDRVPSASLATTDLSPYSLVIVAGDQTDSYYVRLHAQQARLAAWVERGGVLEAHLAGWGSNNGESSLMTIPGGAHAQRSFEVRNRITVPGHPLVAGIADPFEGTFASTGTLIGLPAGALVLTRDPAGGATLALYRLGAGLVIAGTHPYEYGENAGQPSGRLLRNMLPFALAGSGQWLRVAPERVTVAAGDSALATFGLDASALEPGDYLGSLQLTTNDPRSPWRAFPVNLRVANVRGELSISRGELERSPHSRNLDVRLRLPETTPASNMVLADVRLNGIPARAGEGRDDDGDDPDARSAGTASARPDGEHDDDRDDGDSHGTRLRLRFDRAAVLATLPDEGPGELLLSGALTEGGRFLARDTVTFVRQRDHEDDDDALAGGAPPAAGMAAAPEHASLRLGPNPLRANGRLQLELTLARGGRAEVQVFSLDGRLVRDLTAGERPPGVHTLEWDGRDRAGRTAPAGVYLVRVRAPGLAVSRRVVRVR